MRKKYFVWFIKRADENQINREIINKTKIFSEIKDPEENDKFERGKVN